MKMKVNVCLALILANVCLAEAKSQPNLRRIILETETNFVPSEKKDFEALIDRGEDKTKSHKKHKMKGLDGVDLAKKSHLKSLDEHDVKVDVTKLEEQPYETLDAKKTGMVDAVVEEAEKAKEEKKQANKERKKAGKEKKVDATSKSHAMLTLHECGKTEERVAYIVPTKEVPLEVSVGYLVSFDRMKYNEQGDLRFVFEAKAALDTMLEAVPQLLKAWNVKDENIHRLSVVLKENAIILTEQEVDVLSHTYGESFNGGVGDSTRFQRSCERLFGLAAVMDTQPCDYKFAVLAPAEGRFLPRPKPEDRPGLLQSLKKVVGLGQSGEPQQAAPVKAVINLGERRRLVEDSEDGTAKNKEKQERKAKKLAKIEEEEEELLQLPTPVRLMEMVSMSSYVWGHDCGNPTDPAAQAAVRRMEKNALIFSGGKTSSPRYSKVSKLTKNFALFTLQSQLPVVDMKDKAVRFLLELFRASNAAPETPVTTLRGLVLVTLSKIPPENAIYLSDVLLYQYYNMLRNGVTVTNATKTFQHLPACNADNAALLDAAVNFLTVEQKQNFATKARPLMIPKRMVDAGVFNQATIIYDKEPTNNEFQSIY